MELEGLKEELGRLADEVEVLGVRLEEEVQRRKEAEEGWRRTEERAEAVEMEVREECWVEMEGRLEEERRRWMGALGEEVSSPSRFFSCGFCVFVS